MLPITSVWIAILIIVQSTIAGANRDFDTIVRSTTHTSTKLSRNENFFTSPSNTDSDSDLDSVLVHEVGDVLEISWTTTLDVFNVTLWQRELSRGGNGTAGVRSGGNIFSKTSSASTLTNISWIVQPYALDLETSSTFFLSIDAYTNAITNSNSNSKLDYEEWPSTGFVSGLFNISSSSSTTSTQSNADPDTETGEETTTDQRSETTNTPESSLTSTGKIALGLGAGIGAPLISLLAILAYFQVRNARRKYAASQHAQNQHHHPPIPPPPEMSLSMPSLAHHPHHQQGPGPGLYPPPFSVSPSSNPGLNLGEHIPYRNPVPSELSQKVAKPIFHPPWEVDASRESTSPDPTSSNENSNENGVTRANTTITVIPRPNARPRPAARGLGIERERGRRGPGLGEGTGPGKRSMWSTRRVGQPDTTTSSTSTGGTGGPGGPGGRQSTITIGIPELPGENYI
ncbi:hypothetical protein BJY00DRAFT_179670 [Aspergillus carlsbadensis]|nr:hypothetical protein BJY00DRAFT_179670 [Aspergillus carlsbadensis]